MPVARPGRAACKGGRFKSIPTHSPTQSCACAAAVDICAPGQDGTKNCTAPCGIATYSPGGTLASPRPACVACPAGNTSVAGSDAASDRKREAVRRRCLPGGAGGLRRCRIEVWPGMA